MGRVAGGLLLLVLVTPGLARAGGFGGFDAEGSVLDDETRACTPLVVGPDGVAVGRVRCRPVAAAERAGFQRPAQTPPTWAATTRRRALTVTRGGKTVATWTAPVELERVGGLYVGARAEVIAVEVRTRNGTLLVPLRLGGGAPVPVPAPVPAPGPPAADAGPRLPMDIARGTWRQAPVPCERAAVTLELTGERYRLVIETRCQSTRDKLTLTGAVRPGKTSPIELVLENEDGPEDAWPCAPRPCGDAMCLACSDGEDGFELTPDAADTPKTKTKTKTKTAKRKPAVTAPAR